MAPQSFGIYVVEEKVGEGSFGDVYRCRDPFLKKQIAVKALKSHLLQSKDAATIADFFKEAELLAHFDHPAFTHIHSLNPDPPWIAMEFLVGETLEAILRRKEAITLERIAAIFRAVCDGLTHIHEQVEPKYRTIHRDLKPSNILLTRDGRVKIIDFGVAKAGIGDPTIVGIVKGTPLYMSPEHMAGTVDQRSDLWSLAVILFETLTGTRPYPDPDPGQPWTYAKLRRFEHAVLNERPAPLPAEMSPPVSGALAPFFDQAFQVEKEKRFQSALKFRSALERVVDQIARDADPAELAFPPLSEADVLLLEASDAFDRGDYEAARALYEKVLHYTPDSDEAHHWLLQIEDRLHEAEAQKQAELSARRDRLTPAAETLRRIVLRPTIGLPEAALRPAREAVARFERASPEELDAVGAELERASVVVREGLAALLERESEAAIAALAASQGIDGKVASERRKELGRLHAASAADPAAACAALASVREILRRVRQESDEAAGRLVDQAAGVTAHLELFLAQSGPLPAAEAGRRALGDLRDACAGSEPAVLLQKLQAAAGAFGSLAEDSASARREALRQSVGGSCAALQEALPDSLAAPWRLQEFRDGALRAAAEAVRAGHAARLAAVDAALRVALATAGQIEPVLRVPPEPEKPLSPAPAEAAVRPAARPEEGPAVPPASPSRATANPASREEEPGAAAASPVPERAGAPSGAPARKGPAPPPASRTARPAPVPTEARPARPRPERRTAPDELVEEEAPRVRRRPRVEGGVAVGNPRLKWGLVAVGVLAAAVVAFLVLRPGPQPEPSPPPVAATEAGVVVKAIPWGRVEKILDLATQKTVAFPAGATTPARIPLPPGNYRITVSNPDFGRATVEAEVKVGEMRAVALKLPKFDVEKLLDEL